MGEGQSSDEKGAFQWRCLDVIIISVSWADLPVWTCVDCGNARLICSLACSLVSQLLMKSSLTSVDGMVFETLLN